MKQLRNNWSRDAAVKEYVLRCCGGRVSITPKYEFILCIPNHSRFLSTESVFYWRRIK